MLDTIPIEQYWHLFANDAPRDLMAIFRLDTCYFVEVAFNERAQTYDYRFRYTFPSSYKSQAGPWFPGSHSLAEARQRATDRWEDNKHSER